VRPSDARRTRVWSHSAQTLKNHLHANRIKFTQNQADPNIFSVPAGTLEIQGAPLKPQYFLNKVQIKFVDIRAAVTNISLTSEDVSKILSLADEDLPF
jgi:hypothetical protein